jgi:hypothetical protein
MLAYLVSKQFYNSSNDYHVIWYVILLFRISGLEFYTLRRVTDFKVPKL